MPSIGAGHVLGRRQGAFVDLAEDAAQLRLGQEYGGQGGRRLPVGALGGRDDRVGRLGGEQGAGQPLEVAGPHPSGAFQLVGVAGGAGRGQLVDVGEDQLGERRQLLGGHALVDDGARHVAPGDPGADPVRREQRLHRAAAARLAATELVGALERGRHRGAAVGRLARLRKAPSASCTALPMVSPIGPLSASA